MVSDPELEEAADIAINNLRECIDTENQLIEEEHALEDKLLSFMAIFGHIECNMPPELMHVHELNHELLGGMENLTQYLQENELESLCFVKEEKINRLRLKKDTEHRSWQSVKTETDEENKNIQKQSRLEMEHIEEIHHRILVLMKETKKEKVIEAFNKDMALVKKKEEYEREEEHYFMETYKFLRAYERIFRHLRRKEIKLKRRAEKFSGPFKKK